jgi:phasin family protein
MAKQTRNPFLDWDVSKLTEPFAVPGVDAKVLMESQRRNIETLTAANRAAYEGAQAIARRQAEILRDAASEAVKATREFSGASTPQDHFVKQTQLMKQGYEAAIANWRELAEMNAKSSATVVDLISKRVSEGLDEMQKAVHPVA